MRLPFDGSYPISCDFACHLNSSIPAARENPGIDWFMPIGTPHYPVEAGTVIRQAIDQYGGLYVDLIAKVDRNRMWRYVHESRFGHSGEVDEGMHIGFSGSSGIITGPHLHLGCMEHGKWIDPMKYLDIQPISPEEIQLREILKTQRPDVIEAGVPILQWFYNSGVHELIRVLEYLEPGTLAAAQSVPDTGYWLLNWYITLGYKRYGTKPYVWGMKKPKSDTKLHVYKGEKEIGIYNSKDDAFDLWYTHGKGKVIHGSKDISSEFSKMANSLEKQISDLENDLKDATKARDNCFEANRAHLSTIENMKEKFRDLSGLSPKSTFEEQYNAIQEKFMEDVDVVDLKQQVTDLGHKNARLTIDAREFKRSIWWSLYIFFKRNHKKQEQKKNEQQMKEEEEKKVQNKKTEETKDLDFSKDSTSNF